MKKLDAKLVPFLLAMLLVGAGCDNAPSTSENANTNVSMTVNASADAMSDADESEGVEDADDDAPADAGMADGVDDTWQTYTNAALGYSFQWPTKGRYAPKWTVSAAKDSDTSVKDGCALLPGGSSENVTIGGTAFCRTEATAAAGVTTSYATKIGTTNVIVTFTKDAAATGAAGFSMDEYRKELATIMATFTLAKK